MKLSDLFLNRWLYKDSVQSAETLGSTNLSADIIVPPAPAIASGNSTYDVNTNGELLNGAQLNPDIPIPATTLNIANFGWTQTSVFTSVDSDTVSWGAGTFTSADGIHIYAIGGGTTGNMVLTTYIYLDINVSTTAYQQSTTITAPIGIGKVLIAVCKPGSPSATWNLVQATQIVSDNILANTIIAQKMNVAILSAISADLGSITAGTVTGALIRTSAGGTRVVMDGAANEFQIWLSGTLRAQGFDAGWTYYNSSGNSVATIYADSSVYGVSFRIRGNSNSSNVLISPGSSGSVAFTGGTTIKAIMDCGPGVTTFFPAVNYGMNLGGPGFHWADIWCSDISSTSIDTTGIILSGEVITAWSDLDTYLDLSDYALLAGATFTGNVSVGSNTFRCGGILYLNAGNNNAWIYSTGGAIQLQANGAEVLHANSSRTNIRSALQINGTQVVSTRKTAVTAPTGGVTIDSQARTAINSIISRLVSHGLIS
jgi:hypothetical protein